MTLQDRLVIAMALVLGACVIALYLMIDDGE